jgi:hypothetical protein
MTNYFNGAQCVCVCEGLHIALLLAVDVEPWLKSETVKQKVLLHAFQTWSGIC